jgi:hypothetical protein
MATINPRARARVKHGERGEITLGATRRAEGTIRKLGIEGGVWALVTDSGEQIELLDAPAGLQKNGARAEVELEKHDGASIGMVGASGKVRSFKLK